MLGITDFINIAEYANKNWRGKFTKDEVVANARDYYVEYLASIKGKKMTNTMQVLVSNLQEDVANCGSSTNCDLIEKWKWERIKQYITDITNDCNG